MDNTTETAIQLLRSILVDVADMRTGDINDEGEVEFGPFVGWEDLMVGYSPATVRIEWPNLDIMADRIADFLKTVDEKSS
jgi:hypothetical protein